MEALRDVPAWDDVDQLVMDDELARITAAIGLSIARPGTRVTLTALRYAGSLLPQVEALAWTTGVRIQRRRGAGDGLTELVISR